MLTDEEFGRRLKTLSHQRRKSRLEDRAVGLVDTCLRHPGDRVLALYSTQDALDAVRVIIGSRMPPNLVMRVVSGEEKKEFRAGLGN